MLMYQDLYQYFHFSTRLQSNILTDNICMQQLCIKFSPVEHFTDNPKTNSNMLQNIFINAQTKFTKYKVRFNLQIHPIDNV